MTRQLYHLKHPLYPNPDLIDHYTKHKSQYYPVPGSRDSEYQNWYQLVRADHDISGAPERPIYREVTGITRIKASGKEFLLVGEYLYGQDHEFQEQPFWHKYGEYQKPGFKTLYNYDTKKASTVVSGQNETVYFIPYSKKTIDELYEAGPDNLDIELIVQIGSKQYGGRALFTKEEFRDGSIEELARMGRTGKGMYKQVETKLPLGDLATEMKTLGVTQNTQYQEFLEFQKWKQMQMQQLQQQQQLKENSSSSSSSSSSKK